jgi:SAM-dependent methyltransferase
MGRGKSLLWGAQRFEIPQFQSDSHHSSRAPAKWKHQPAGSTPVIEDALWTEPRLNSGPDGLENMVYVALADISPSMIEEARKNCQKCGAESASFFLVDEFWSLPSSSFDFVHTFIVLQHISVRRGGEIIRKLISVLVDGGIGAIQVTYSDRRSEFYR